MRIKVAGYVFEINNLYPYCEQFMTDYITTEEPVHIITITREFLCECRKSDNLNNSPLYYIEYLEIYRSICHYITERDGILIHGAVIEMEGCAYLFTAPSGTGKTTHINQWLSLYADKVRVINGDKPIIRYLNGEFIVYGTPWSGKEHLNINVCAPLKGIVLLSRGEQNEIERMEQKVFNHRLIKQVYLPADSALTIKALEFSDKLFTSVPLYSLKCNISLDAARVAKEAIHTETVTQ